MYILDDKEINNMNVENTTDSTYDFNDDKLDDLIKRIKVIILAILLFLLIASKNVLVQLFQEP